MKKYKIRKLTPLEKAQQDAQDFAYNMYESLLVNAYMISGSFVPDQDILEVVLGYSSHPTSGSQGPDGHTNV